MTSIVAIANCVLKGFELMVEAFPNLKVMRTHKSNVRSNSQTRFNFSNGIEDKIAKAEILRYLQVVNGNYWFDSTESDG